MRSLYYILASVVIYVTLCYTPIFKAIAMPIEMLCTFLHEFGHAFFAIVTGGKVHSLAVNPDGSGVTTTSGGNNALITMGGYVGSALFGNVMVRMTSDEASKIALKVISASMAISAMIWFNNLFTSGMLIAFAMVLYTLSNTIASAFVLNFLGIASIIYIVQDFNVGPTSDLKAYEKTVGIFPANVWMYVWLGLVLYMTFVNVRNIVRNLH